MALHQDITRSYCRSGVSIQVNLDASEADTITNTKANCNIRGLKPGGMIMNEFISRV